MAFPSPACGIAPVVIPAFGTKLSSYLLDSLLIDFYWFLGKPAIRPVKQEQHGEPKAVRTTLRHNEHLICEGQHPRFGGGGVIEHVPDSMWKGCRVTCKTCDTFPVHRRSRAFLVANLCRE